VKSVEKNIKVDLQTFYCNTCNVMLYIG